MLTGCENDASARGPDLACKLHAARRGYGSGLAPETAAAMTTPQAKLGEIEPIYVKQPSIRTSFDQPFAPPPTDDVALGLPKRH